MIAANAFGALLRAHREEARLSCNELARLIHVDPSYVSRVERTEREPPRREIVERTVAVLALSDTAADALFVAAGYVPATVLRLGGWTPTLDAVAGVLSDPALSVADRAAFASIVQQLAVHWRAGGAGAAGARERAG